MGSEEGTDAECGSYSTAYCRLLVKLLLDDDDDVRYSADNVVSRAGRYQVDWSVDVFGLESHDLASSAI